MRILHFADLHLGVENYGRPDPETGLSSRFLDFVRAFDELVDYALADDVHLVLFAGDAYKARDPSQTQQREFAKRIRRLVENGISVFLLVGNHDLPNALGRASALEIFDTLGIQRVYVGDRPDTQMVETRGGPAQVVSVPWLTPSRILAKDAHKNLNIDELHRLMEETASEFIREAGEHLDPDIPSILTAHLALMGSKVKSGSERSMVVGNYPSFNLSSLHSHLFDYVALGHHHPHQILGVGAPIVYSGSMQRVDFGEEHDDKGFYVTDLDAAKPRGQRAGEPRFHPVTARRFLTVDLQPREADPTAEVLAAIAGADIAEAIVRVILHMRPEQAGLLREAEVRRALEPAHYLAGVQRDLESAERRRAPAHVRLERMPVLQQLELYFRQKETPEDKAATLLSYAHELMGQESER